MSGINFLSTNLVDNATLTLTTGTPNAQFPLSNVQNESTAIKFRSTGNTAVIEFDLGVASDIDTIAITGDATDTLGVSVMSVKTSTTSDFSLSTPIPITLSAEFNIGFEFITLVNHRFVEITFTGNGTFAEISNIFIGKRTNLASNSLSIGTFNYGFSDNSSIRTNRYGQKFIDERNKTKLISGTIEFANTTEQETLDDIYIQHGITQPIWLILDVNSDAINDGKFRLTMYSYFDSIPQWTASGGQTYNTNLDFRQVI